MINKAKQKHTDDNVILVGSISDKEIQEIFDEKMRDIGKFATTVLNRLEKFKEKSRR